MSELIRYNIDEDYADRYHLLLGGVASDGRYRLGRVSIDHAAGPDDWLATHPTEAQAAINAGQLDELREARIDWDGLEADLDNEVAWLDTTIPLIDTMTAGEVRNVVKRLAQEQRQELRAWRYLVRRLT